MSTAAGPAVSWDDPLTAGKARAVPQATAPAAAVAGWDDPLPGYSNEIGPQEASVDDAVAAGDNHLRAVQRGRGEAADREAGQ
jgi:hypothetical protein